MITPNGKWVYVDNAGTFTVAGFSIPSNGTLSPIASTIVSTLPEGVNNLDMTTSADGEYLFNLLSGTGAIGVFTINSDGTLKQLGDIEGLPKPQASTVSQPSSCSAGIEPRAAGHIARGIIHCDAVTEITTNRAGDGELRFQ